MIIIDFIYLSLCPQVVYPSLIQPAVLKSIMFYEYRQTVFLYICSCPKYTKFLWCHQFDALLLMYVEYRAVELLLSIAVYVKMRWMCTLLIVVVNCCLVLSILIVSQNRTAIVLKQQWSLVHCFSYRWPLTMSLLWKPGQKCNLIPFPPLDGIYLKISLGFIPLNSLTKTA